MPPFMAAELGAGFDIERALQIRLVPLIWQAADSQASLGAYASLAREAEIPRKRAEIYLAILEDLLLAFRLPAFQRRAQRQLAQQHQRQLVQQQNYFHFDAGSYRALRAFAHDYPEAELLLLSLAPEPLLLDGIHCEPLEAWLRQLQP